uniref:Dehydrogenase/reductase SDR family member 1 n=1 Tax=Syphacia muris TaxID=451379 RepID=A0A0N5A9D9_9BILA
MSLKGKVALVTGASRGIGRGIALQLGAAGATVYITGRTADRSDRRFNSSFPSLETTANGNSIFSVLVYAYPEITDRGGRGIFVYCDHSFTEEVEMLFNRIKFETNGQLDILVNNVFSASLELPNVIGKSFWEYGPQLWDMINDVGLRNHYYCSVYAARMMVTRRQGLIVNIGSVGGLKYFINVPYGVGKCAMDRMAIDMSEELKKHCVTVLSLWPGIVRTEVVEGLLNSGRFDHKETVKYMKENPLESPEFSGKVVVALATDPNIRRKAGRIVIAADAGIEYKLKDTDGHEPSSLRSLKTLLSLGGFRNVASYFPIRIRLPGWVLTASTNRL